jgi:hypothetical protein
MPVPVAQLLVQITPGEPDPGELLKPLSVMGGPVPVPVPVGLAESFGLGENEPLTSHKKNKNGSQLAVGTPVVAIIPSVSVAEAVLVPTSLGQLGSHKVAGIVLLQVPGPSSP